MMHKKWPVILKFNPRYLTVEINLNLKLFLIIADNGPFHFLYAPPPPPPLKPFFFLGGGRFKGTLFSCGEGAEILTQNFVGVNIIESSWRIKTPIMCEVVTFLCQRLK